MPKSKRNKLGENDQPGTSSLLLKKLVMSFLRRKLMLCVFGSLSCACMYCVAVTLSKTKKKGKEHKESLVKSVRDSLDEYMSLYIFSFENMRNTKFKEFKEKLKSSSRYRVFPVLRL